MSASQNSTLSDISPAQARAARALLGWTLEDLEGACGLPRRTLIRFENADVKPRVTTIQAIRSALEAAGVIFIEQNGEGPGVRLKKDKV